MPDSLVRDRRELEPSLIDTRRALHRRPELAFAESETAALVARRLGELGLEPRTGVGGTGVTADLDGVEAGPTLLLRADMDALPLDEEPGREYGSQIPGVMHACGHDAHTSSLLGTAALLATRTAQINGKVRFLFQPAEEVGEGASAVIADGALDGVDEALAAHVYSGLPVGQAVVPAGDMMAGADLFELEVRGGGGHGALAHESRDAVLAAATLVSALQSIVARETSPMEPVVLSIASIDGGRAANVVTRSVTLRGTVRWFDSDEHDRVLRRIDEIADGVCRALRVHHELRVMCSIPVLGCAEMPVAALARAATDAGLTVLDPGPLPTSEDFAFIAQQVPVGFVLVGAGGEGCGSHHAPDFDIDERAVGLSAEVLARATLDRLGGT